MTGPGGENQQETAFVTFQQKGTELTGSGGPDETRQATVDITRVK